MGFEFGKGALWCVLNIALDRFIVAEYRKNLGLFSSEIREEGVCLR